MTFRNHHREPSLSVVCWSGLSAVLLGLLVLVLSGSRMVRAGTLTKALPSSYVDLDASPTVTNTIFLPVVYQCKTLNTVEIAGPTSAIVGRPQTFTATVTPATVSLPVTYTWQIAGQAPVVHGGGLSDMASLAWDSPGTQAVTVEATNRCGGVVSDIYQVTVSTRGMIAFERQLANGKHDIYIMHNDGTGEQNITNNPNLDDGAPTWSPDGNYLAFARAPTKDDKHAIYKMDLRTRQVIQLTTGEYDDRWPSWSPDGDQIAFMREYGLLRQIYVMNADGTNQQQLTDYDQGESEYPAWSRDGEWIAFSAWRFYQGNVFAGPDLWVMRPDGSDQHVVLRTDRPEPPDGHERDRRDEMYPSWAPNGQIYYSYRVRDYPAAKTEFMYRIWPDGSLREKVFNDSYDRYIASFAPDGQCFVFYSVLGGPDKEVWKWCNGFVAAVNLTDNSGIDDEFCAWSPAP